MENRRVNIIISNVEKFGGLKMNTAQLITTGDNQTVILPKQFQLQGTEVYIKKIGNAVVLISKDNPWQTLFDSLNLFSDDFMPTREQPNLDVRETLE
jgi:antitoxin VapB